MKTFRRIYNPSLYCDLFQILFMGHECLKALISSHFDVNFSPSSSRGVNIYSVFSVLTVRSTLLLATNKASRLFFTICMGWITHKVIFDKHPVPFSRSLIWIALKGTNFSASITVHVPNRHTYRGLATYISAHSTTSSVSPSIYFIDILSACCAKVIFLEIPAQSAKKFLQNYPCSCLLIRLFLECF